MKSLTYFSKFNRNKEGEDSSGLDIQNLQDSMDNMDRKSFEGATDEDDLTHKTTKNEDEHQQLNES